MSIAFLIILFTNESKSTQRSLCTKKCKTQPNRNLSLLFVSDYFLRYFSNNTPLSLPLSINGYITSLWHWSWSSFALGFTVVFAWNAFFCLLLCFTPAELICCKSGSPLVAGVPVRPWKILVVVGVFPTSLLGFNASPFLAFAAAGCMVFPTSPSARRGVVNGALLDWKDFAAPNFLPV